MKAAFRGTVRDFLHFNNDPALGETVSFLPLLSRVDNIDPRHVTFYAHAKGVRHDPGSERMTRRWSSVMYSNMLDYPAVVEDSLLTHQFAGSFLKSGIAFTNLPATHHYSGSFYWFRNAKLFNQLGWNRVPRQYWGTEAWPGVVCPKGQAACLLHETAGNPGCYYQAKYWENTVDDVWHQWQLSHANLHRHAAYSEVLNALRARGDKKIVVSGPQRSGTLIASKMLAADLNLPHLYENDFDPHDMGSFVGATAARPAYVVQAPTVSHRVHELPPDVAVVWMRRDLSSVLRSSRRVNWTRYEQLEKDRYFDHSHRPAAVVKHEAWERFQRIALAERAFDLDYESLRGHPLWINPEDRKDFEMWQTERTGERRAGESYPCK